MHLRAGFMRLANFVATRPQFEVTQNHSLDWLAAAHAEAEATLSELDHEQKANYSGRIARLLARCACSPHQVAARGHSVRDVERAGFANNELYDMREHPHGRGWSTRSELFETIVDDYFVHAYEHVQEPPDDLIHVTCTGYISPSGAQKLVSQRGWGAQTRVTHAYQMGCYAAVPALRIAAGCTALGARRVDIVHTELCSLHLDPADHRVEQLVVQSLFADGLIRYSMISDERVAGLEIAAIHEVVLPASTESMKWEVGDWGMRMTLGRDVPDKIAAALRGFVLELYRRAGVDVGRMKRSVFAVHPGGPKIIDAVRNVLELSEPQVEASRGVLHDFGNMSSATLPHVWMRLLEDPRIARGTLIPSLAFGPGLTICGALLEKR